MGALSAAALRTFVAPTRYVQGPGAVDSIGRLVARRRQRAAVLVDGHLVDTIGRRLADSLEAAGVPTAVVVAGGEVTPPLINALATTAGAHHADVVIAAGGGKVLDQGKGVARVLEVPIVTVPTIASNDGPASRVIAMYDEHHQLVDTPQMVANPELVLVDTTVIAAAPGRYLRSGIGDALAKKFEADACRRAGGVTSHGEPALALPGMIADGCYETLLKYGVAALDGDPTALERVVEAAVLMSGLAFENGGLSLAHAMTRGFMILPGARRHLHGFHVAYGLLVQLAHESDERYATVRDFLGTVGLPCSLADLDTDAGEATRRALVSSVMSSAHRTNCDPCPSVKSVRAAIDLVEADALGTASEPSAHIKTPGQRARTERRA